MGFVRLGKRGTMDANIVVIDNDDTMRDLFTLCLKRRDWQVFSYSYDHINLAALKQHNPDIIILDFNHQDGGRGWELLQILKMEDTTANIPILITTTITDLSVEIRGYLSTRYINVVLKPFDVNNLLGLVQKTLTLANQAGAIFSSDQALPILVVEDTEHLRDAITTVLSMEGYPFATAYNGLAALDSVFRTEYCLILLDLAMPIMNGFEFLSAYDRQLRPHSPVIILSAETDITPDTLPTFVVDVLSKPFNIKHLLRLVAKYAQPV